MDCVTRASDNDAVVVLFECGDGNTAPILVPKRDVGNQRSECRRDTERTDDKAVHEHDHRRVRGHGPVGEPLAEELAQDIARFPQVCVRADRRSAIKSHGLSVRDALIQEWYNGREALVKDGAVIGYEPNVVGTNGYEETAGSQDRKSVV